MVIENPDVTGPWHPNIVSRLQLHKFVPEEIGN